MAASNFTIIFKDENNVVDLRPIPVEATYKSATKIAAAMMTGERVTIIAVVETWKLYPNENEKKTNTTNMDSE